MSKKSVLTEKVQHTSSNYKCEQTRIIIVYIWLYYINRYYIDNERHYNMYKRAVQAKMQYT